MGTLTESHNGRSLTKDSEGVYRIQHDLHTDGLCVTIAEALAEIKGIAPATLIDNFSTYADLDALNRLFRVRPNGEHRDLAGSLELNIHGADVTVHANGEIEIEA